MVSTINNVSKVGWLAGGRAGRPTDRPTEWLAGRHANKRCSWGEGVKDASLALRANLLTVRPAPGGLTGWRLRASMGLPCGARGRLLLGERGCWPAGQTELLLGWWRAVCVGSIIFFGSPAVPLLAVRKEAFGRVGHDSLSLPLELLEGSLVLAKRRADERASERVRPSGELTG